MSFFGNDVLLGVGNVACKRPFRATQRMTKFFTKFQLTFEHIPFGRLLRSLRVASRPGCCLCILRTRMMVAEPRRMRLVSRTRRSGLFSYSVTDKKFVNDRKPSIVAEKWSARQQNCFHFLTDQFT